MPTWTTAADVTDRWVDAQPLALTAAQIDTLLEDAEDHVLREFPDMQTRIDRAAGTDLTEGPAVPVARVVKVVARMVIRHLLNPLGVRSLQQGAGPFQQNTTYGGDEPGLLYLSSRDRAELGAVGGSGAFTVDTLPAGYVSVPPDAWTSGDTWVLP